MFKCEFERVGQDPVHPRDLKPNTTYMVVKSECDSFPIGEYVAFFRLPTSNIVTHVLVLGPGKGQFYTANAFTRLDNDEPCVKVAPGDVCANVTFGRG